MTIHQAKIDKRRINGSQVSCHGPADHKNLCLKNIDIVDTKQKLGARQIICPYCQTLFNHNGRPSLQTCPNCQAKLLLSLRLSLSSMTCFLHILALCNQNLRALRRKVDLQYLCCQEQEVKIRNPNPKSQGGENTRLAIQPL